MIEDRIEMTVRWDAKKDKLSFHEPLMRIRILSITHKTPAWIQEGYEEYSKRFTGGFSVQLVEVPAEKRGKQADIARIRQREGEKILQLIPPQNFVIALEVKGEAWSTEQLSQQLKLWQQQGKNVDLLVGGADGLSEACLTRAQKKWSLSSLTFPHLFIRIMLVEQLYRAWSILEHHPYHR